MLLIRVLTKLSPLAEVRTLAEVYLVLYLRKRSQHITSPCTGVNRLQTSLQWPRVDFEGQKKLPNAFSIRLQLSG